MKLYLFVWIFGLCYADDRPSVETSLGVIRGLSIKTRFKNQEYTVNRYAGLRYAKPPVGVLRFQMPVPYGSYESPIDAADFTSACPQNDMMKLGTDSVDEDCLSLTIYVPTDSPQSAEYAVMIFVHGGGFAMGGANIYPAEVLSAVGNVIVVVINYRLGLLGFANTGDGQIRGNLGLFDQHLAFQWVHDNIAAFGGDPSRVTIFGESAGAVSVSLQGLYPGNKGLFHNVIAQSGAPTMPFHLMKDNLQSLLFVAENLGCSTESVAEIVACLRNVDAATLISKLGELTADIQNQVRLQFMPTIDDEFLKRTPLDMYSVARNERVEEIEFVRSVNLLTGVNNAEGSMWLMLLGDIDPETVVVSYDDMRNVHIPNMVAAFMNPKQRPVPEAVVSVIASEYADYSDRTNAREMYIKMMGDMFFNVPCQDLTNVHANSSTSRTWTYLFDAPVAKHVIPMPAWVKGANHGDELPALFGYNLVELGGMFNLTDFSPPLWELDLSDRIMTYWSNFAKHSDPNGEIEENLWPRFTLESGQHMRFSEKDTVGRNHLAGEVNLWREVVPLVWDAVEHTPVRTDVIDSCEVDGECG